MPFNPNNPNDPIIYFINDLGQREVGLNSQIPQFLNMGFRIDDARMREAAATEAAKAPPAPERPSVRIGEPPFREGLTDAQQNSIRNLVANKPVSSWNATDIANWNYATANAPLPEGAAKPEESVKVGAAGTPPTEVLTPGATETVGGAEQGAQDTMGDLASQKAKLNEMGIDTSQLSEQQISSLFAMSLFLDLRASEEKEIVPPTLSTADMESFLDQARKEFKIPFAERLEAGRQDFLSAVASISGEAQELEAAQRLQYAVQRRQEAESSAESGLARSGIRRRALSEMEAQEQGLIRSRRRKIGEAVERTGREFERAFGSEELARAGGVQPIGYYGQTIGYTPTGGLRGTVGAEQETQTRLRAQEIGEAELKRRLLESGFIS